MIGRKMTAFCRSRPVNGIYDLTLTAKSNLA